MDIKIPKIIHQLWLGDNEMPEHCKRFVEEMKKLHPDYEHHLWGNEVFEEKYKDDKMLQSQETMKIFKENNVSPFGGCLPMFIQMPVWFALYNALLYSVELYNSSFLYLQDLTSPDPYGILPVMYGI